MSSLHIPAPGQMARTIRVPGDKSISHRAILFAAIAQGVTTVRNCNRGEDVNATLGALRSLGVEVAQTNGEITINGVQEFSDPRSAIDCGNSGTTMRLLVGLLAGRVNAVLDGDDSLRRRPMERVAAPLRAMGADVACAKGGVPPIRLARSSAPLHGTTNELPMASAQLKSALLLAGLHAHGTTTILSPNASRNHSELMLAAMGADIEADDRRVAIRASALRSLGVCEVPGDLSAAAYFVGAATCLPGSRISVLDTGINPTRTAVIDILCDMGAHISIRGLREQHGEPAADIEVSAASPLVNLSLNAERIANAIDEIPLLCAVAAHAPGTFEVRGAAELRVKESDRIASTVALLRAFGVAVTELPDGIAVRGGRPLRPPARISSGGDHRIGLTAAMLAAIAGAPIVIDDAACIATSYPGFESAWLLAFGHAP